MAEVADFTVALLLGGEARRLPDKLERPLGESTLMERAIAFGRSLGPLVLLGREEQRARSARYGVPFIGDRHPGGGPLPAILGAFEAIEDPWVLVLAADLPALTRELPERLLAHRLPGVEAVVPQHAGGIEPLCALYERRAALRAAATSSANEGPRALLEQMRVAYVEFPEALFLNVNTEADWSQLQERYLSR
uniref:MobA-like NTP transferase domain-containing protein n=1 Tax=mine drainage metagenome TaxID=410659 RepID=E6Q6F9_9ZZZZ